MQQWINPSHPQTLQAAVILGYITAVFSVIGGSNGLLLVMALLIGGGAFGVANNKKLGWIALLAGSVLLVLFRLYVLAIVFPSLNPTLEVINGTIFPAALLGAVVHAHSREYINIWFE